MEKLLLEMRSISKSYNGYEVLRDINISLKHGEIHAILGENGAGKSVLMRILAGVEGCDSGEILIDGQPVSMDNPRKAQELGISIIFQDSQLVSSLNVIDNIFLGRWPIRTFKLLPIINWGRTFKDFERLLEDLEFEIDPHAKVSSLGAGQRKMVEVAKALCWQSRVLIIDEATAVLTDHETEKLFKILEKIKHMGVSIFFISHKINEVVKIADRVTVLRDGSLIDTSEAKDADMTSIVYKMAGREFVNRYPKINKEIGKEVLRVEHLGDNGILEDISFSMRQREILGLTGLVGSGRTAVARAIVGLNRLNKGKIFINGREQCIAGPADAIRNKIGFISENRNESLIYNFGIQENISISDMSSVATNYNIDLALEKRLTDHYIKQLGIKARDAGQRVKQLSGGNQQKVMIARSLLTCSRIFIFDEPTKGLDIPSKVETYNLMNEFILREGAILFISSDLEELIGMCDRILILNKGRIVGELSGKEMKETSIVFYASVGEDKQQSRMN